MTGREPLNGKPYAGNPHVRFDEGKIVSACTAAIETEGRNSPSIAQGLPLCVCSAFMMLVQVTLSTAHAASPIGPEAWRVDAAEDVSFVEEGLVVPANSGTTVRRGIFCPKGGPVGVSEVLWRNVKLSDVETFTGKVSIKSSEGYFWKDVECYHTITNEENGYVQCQLQVENGSTVFGFIMRYSQDGNDVKGELHAAKVIWTTGSQYLGCDMSNRGGCDHGHEHAVCCG